VVVDDDVVESSAGVVNSVRGDRTTVDEVVDGPVVVVLSNGSDDAVTGAEASAERVRSCCPPK
jgi:hypothetical protein